MDIADKTSTKFNKERNFPLNYEKPREWVTIHKLAPSFPKINRELIWKDILPSEVNALADVIESIVNSPHPFEHQVKALEHLLESPSRKAKSSLIINGGTYSGKSLSFSIPGITKILMQKTDFFVVFYPSKQLLLDQFDRMKELVVKLEEKTSIRLTVKMYSGDISRSISSTQTRQVQKQELIETEQCPPNIILATFDKVWYQLMSGKKTPLLEKIMKCQYMVFDEIHAFEGFAAAIIRGFIKIHLKKNPKCQFVLSSATIDNVVSFRDDFLPDAEIITCPPVRGEQEFLGITKEHTIPILTELWQELETTLGKFCLVFLDSKEDIELLTERLCTKLKQIHPFFDVESVAMIHADLPYNQRKKILDEIKKGKRNKIRILFSSSVLELGVNLHNVQVVINIGVPITQKDGIVQRSARNRSKPDEKRVNIFIFDLANPRDDFYWHHLEILQNILETNACNPILYPKQNPKILAGLFVLHLRYEINDFQEIMTFFIKESLKVHELARQQYTKLVSLNVLKKEHGKVLFTSHGENILLQHLKSKNVLFPLSIRAISTDWTIKLKQGLDNNLYAVRTAQLGKISTRDVLKKGLPDNLIIRNRQKYLVTEVDHQQRNILVKKFIANKNIDNFSLPPMNRLYDPSISIGVFPKKVRGTKLVNINFGQINIQRKPKIIVNANPEKILLNDLNKDNNIFCFWQELTQQESDELAITEKSEGIIIGLETDLLKPKNLTIKKLLKLFGRILLIETEMVLSIPASEFSLAFNSNQLAIYDKGEPNGNAEYLFLHLQKVAQQTLQRLVQCPCERGCKNCYGEMIGLLPEDSKDYLKLLVKDLTNISELDFHDVTNKIRTNLQFKYQENRIVAVSDIHLTNELCYQEEFFEAISQLSKKADILIINGDLLDKISEEGWQVFSRLKTKALQEGFWSKLVFVRSSSIHDGNLEQFSGFLHQDYVYIETNTDQVLFVHGNKIGIDSNLANRIGIEVSAIQTKKELVKTGRSWLPKISEATHLVIGHLHYRFYNERFRVYGLGHWLKKGNPYHQKVVMILNSLNILDMIRLIPFDEII